MTTQPQDKMRAEFEAWACDQMDVMATENCFDRCRITGRYQFAFMEAKWEVWQAACAQQSAQCQQDALDARRYRWVRDDGDAELYLHNQEGINNCKTVCGESLDSAIDAARASNGGQ